MAKDSRRGIDNLLLVSRKPTHPGEILREEFMPEYGLTVASLAKRLQVSRQSVNELVHERRSVSTDMALRLAKLFGTTPHYWLNLQRNADIWASLDEGIVPLSQIEPVGAPADVQAGVPAKESRMTLIPLDST